MHEGLVEGLACPITRHDVLEEMPRPKLKRPAVSSLSVYEPRADHHGARGRAEARPCRCKNFLHGLTEGSRERIALGAALTLRQPQARRSPWRRAPWRAPPRSGRRAVSWEPWEA